MALTTFQRDICGLIAKNRIQHGESYVAGGIALNEYSRSARISDDIDLFHDTAEAVSESFASDSELLSIHNYEVRVKRQQAGYVEAVIGKGTDTTAIQWTADSAFRYFPLVEHDEFGLTMHPLDLASNKVLALVGRLAARDWVDVIEADKKIQRLGYLAWAASGKDPSFSPGMILTEAKRSARYTASELANLQFEGNPPDAAELGRQWHNLMSDAEQIVSLLSEQEGGKCVLTNTGVIYSGDVASLQKAISSGEICFHEGRIRGAFPRFM